ncbi:hypothetical protein EYF80_009186 [Liparis tanakae]|uniref:Uncharacterized protein n=1 Tax=Liparis tanakae TaxID=230148 RepID=A0A4Z2ISV2_9TELE|nr:hypothetical protein EYF80_009186 [Liparis tanakae]
MAAPQAKQETGLPHSGISSQDDPAWVTHGKGQTVTAGAAGVLREVLHTRAEPEEELYPAGPLQGRPQAIVAVMQLPVGRPVHTEGERQRELEWAVKKELRGQEHLCLIRCIHQCVEEQVTDSLPGHQRTGARSHLGMNLACSPSLISKFSQATDTSAPSESMSSA